MNMIMLMNIVNHPDIIPDYLQKNGKIYCDIFQPEITWKFHVIDGRNWFECFHNQNGMVKGERHSYDHFNKVSFVAEVKDV